MLESLVAKLRSNESFLSVEVSPRLSATIGQNVIDELESLEQADCFVCTDSPLARLKPSSILSSIKLQNALNKPLICTLSMRDRNSIALCGDILAANEFGLRAFLSLSGDSVKNGDCAGAKGVFEESSLKLGRIIEDLNQGVAANGKALKDGVKPIYNFSVINSHANNTESLKKKMLKKLSNSKVEGLFTQPVFSLQSAQFLLESLEEINENLEQKCVMILGFFPVLNYKVALFLRDKLPGVYIPNEWVERLEKASIRSKEEEQKVGLELSRELFFGLQTLHNKFHFMSANKPSLLKEFVRG
ncbi:methylenetetrahydrofolate reductase [Helicobacter trogontum]|uniref:Methylenetetrahydrofolate reductase n=1 Tax=Helicobacter trogontum TaxID=50960 RepID=A0A4U8SCD2_9HELI|nr:methylenetetrahydrofolate reductase [Helicobacter trogontum]TLD83617.1 methylenetetrahydrofolate reductase [Helicobacter trogontum]